LFALHRDQAQRPGQAQWRREVRGSPPTTAILLARTPNEALPNVAARPSKAVKGVRGSPPTTTQHAHAQKKAKRKRPGGAQRKRELRVSSPSTAIQSARTPKKAKPSAAASLSAAEKGVRGFLPTTVTQLARAPKKAKPSTAARPIAAEKGGAGVSPTTTQQQIHAHTGRIGT
jgi:hypothetical protein